MYAIYFNSMSLIWHTKSNHLLTPVLYNANLILLDVVHAWIGTTPIALGFCNCAVSLHPPYLITDLHGGD